MASSKMDTSSSSDSEEDIGQQVRVSFVLDPSVSDRSLEVPSDPIAVPADLRKKGLSAVINHLLDRKVVSNEDEDDSDSDNDKLDSLPFDFLVANRLLRTGVETAARHHGLSLEQAIKISYFPAQEAPQESETGEPVPDWIGCMSHTDGIVCTGAYDGSIVLFSSGDDSLQTVASTKAHSGPIKCLSSLLDTQNDNIIIATGSMDQTLVTHTYNASTKSLEQHANFVGGHSSSIGSVDMFASSHQQQQRMVSGDWNGGLALWNLHQSNDKDDAAMEEPVKKRKTSNKSKQQSVLNIAPLTKFQAHSSQISGIAWTDENTLVTASWDHSLKVWNVERQETLLTLNGSRVMACMDASPHSQVVATGHPDCTIRLWDVRTNSDVSSSLVSDSSLKPSHKAWVSAVKWSRNDPFVLASTSHDGTVKVWDIRSTLPLHTVRAFSKEDKGLCLAFGDGEIFAGGSDCIVKQYKC